MINKLVLHHQPLNMKIKNGKGIHPLCHTSCTSYLEFYFLAASQMVCPAEQPGTLLTVNKTLLECTIIINDGPVLAYCELLH
jgi:hypothetical protein